uniref:Uncharacterized protein n=1 Tax=Solanum tuberosum TaxID=4113 RepID=M1DR25_SOLTU
MISRRPTGIRIRSDSTNSLTSRDTPIHCYSKQAGPYSRVPPHINPPSTYMYPPLEYTQPPPHVVVPTSGYATPHGYSVLPPEANRPTSSDSRTVTHNPIDSQPSSSSTSKLGMSSLRLQGNDSEPNTPSTNQSATPGRVLTQVGVRDMHNRLVIEPDGYTLLMKARKKNKNPRWILPEDWKKLLVHWANDPRFKQMSEIGKTQAEAFKATHIRKKKNPEDPDVWVEPRAEMTYVSL